MVVVTSGKMKLQDMDVNEQLFLLAILLSNLK